MSNGESDPREIYQRLAELCRAEVWDQAAALARRLPAGDLNSYPYHDLWWHFAEALADHAPATKPTLSRRLYELVEGSYVKEASMATGAAEARAVLPHLERVRHKLDRR
jgi:hypothetical protein